MFSDNAEGDDDDLEAAPKDEEMGAVEVEAMDDEGYGDDADASDPLLGDGAKEGGEADAAGGEKKDDGKKDDKKDDKGGKKEDDDKNDDDGDDPDKKVIAITVEQ